ncbi:helix-turn-helix transcriptional regulator [Streptomyces sp. NBC_01218]|uniref:winged helix-turn-helix transcriptional regulator n=1 Tax=unclassified Streptomyces TaxID=2593676 RepID=UPI0023B9C697|nr:MULTISPECIES: helix-turn-helix domain-containing protein [unclassified Streptomyces]WEH42637.1 helix-turn-helix domain-containing protein [Streptomyces sp. AM 2-1-1]WSQ54261.1 helix-turn-helix transcriptional regulator [Streptomyces sp. NBC_01218]
MERVLADCRVRLGFDLLTHTWNAPVIQALEAGPRRPRDLRTEIGSISPKVLNETLRRLAGYALVERTVPAGAPRRVEYALTPLGRTLLEPIAAMGRWSAEHGDAFVAAQDWDD